MNWPCTCGCDGCVGRFVGSQHCLESLVGCRLDAREDSLDDDS